jgi:nucleoside-diphosphate-sugar epimerase
MLERVAGRSIHPRHVPFEGAGTDRRLPDVSRAERVLGLRPRVALEEGLRRTYEWYAQQFVESIG